MRQIELTHGKIAIIDAEDYERVAAHTWHYKPATNGENGYAGTTIRIDGRGRKTKLHRFILNAPPGINVDHRDGNGLNNRKSNLRLATQQQNCLNRKPNKGSKYKGVRRDKSGNWFARIQRGMTRYYLGAFPTAEQAAEAYNKKAVELHGEFAKLNIINME